MMDVQVILTCTVELFLVGSNVARHDKNGDLQDSRCGQVRVVGEVLGGEESPLVNSHVTWGGSD